jgi:hypothetical protein
VGFDKQVQLVPFPFPGSSPLMSGCLCIDLENPLDGVAVLARGSLLPLEAIPKPDITSLSSKKAQIAAVLIPRRIHFVRSSEIIVSFLSGAWQVYYRLNTRSSTANLAIAVLNGQAAGGYLRGRLPREGVH